MVTKEDFARYTDRSIGDHDADDNARLLGLIGTVLCDIRHELKQFNDAAPKEFKDVRDILREIRYNTLKL